MVIVVASIDIHCTVYTPSDNTHDVTSQIAKQGKNLLIYIRIISASQIAPIGEGLKCYAEIGLRRGGGTVSCLQLIGPLRTNLAHVVPNYQSSIPMLTPPSLNGLRTNNVTFIFSKAISAYIGAAIHQPYTGSR